MCEDLGSRLLQRVIRLRTSDLRVGKQEWACRRVAGEVQLWCECKYSEDTNACMFNDRGKSRQSTAEFSCKG